MSDSKETGSIYFTMEKLSELDTYLNNLSKLTSSINIYILGHTEQELVNSLTSITNQSRIIGEMILKSQLILSMIDINYDDSNDEKKIHDYQEQLDEIINNYQSIKDFISFETQQTQNTNLGTLTILSAVLLPISIIVGYFGMNFKSMGNITQNTGILALPHAQIFVFVLFLIGTLIILYLLFYLPSSTQNTTLISI